MENGVGEERWEWVGWGRGIGRGVEMKSRSHTKQFWVKNYGTNGYFSLIC